MPPLPPFDLMDQSTRKGGYTPLVGGYRAHRERQPIVKANVRRLIRRKVDSKKGDDIILDRPKNVYTGDERPSVSVLAGRPKKEHGNDIDEEIFDRFENVYIVDKKHSLGTPFEKQASDRREFRQTNWDLPRNLNLGNGVAPEDGVSPKSSPMPSPLPDLPAGPLSMDELRAELESMSDEIRRGWSLNRNN